MKTLRTLFKYYFKKIEDVYLNKHRNEDAVKFVCKSIEQSVSDYLNGFPAKAYDGFENLMNSLIYTQSTFYTDLERIQPENNDLSFFRVAKVINYEPYKRERLFHTPYNLRSKVSTSRYSIAGFPSLYLGTSLELCCEEIHANLFQDLVLASRFIFKNDWQFAKMTVKIIDLGVKPQDFFESEKYFNERNCIRNVISSSDAKSNYLLWYPLVAASSFIRTNRDDPFAAEYIIPQLLMQWARGKFIKGDKVEGDELVGIRYFSCASFKSSKKGLNYVLPSSGESISSELPYCPTLARNLFLSSPVFINEYDSIDRCEQYLMDVKKFDSIENL